MNQSVTIIKAYSSDTQFNLKEGAGSDAVHTTPIYATLFVNLKRIVIWKV